MIQEFGLAGSRRFSASPRSCRGADTARLDLAPRGGGAARGLARPLAHVRRRPRPARRRQWCCTTRCSAGRATPGRATHNWSSHKPRKPEPGHARGSVTRRAGGIGGVVRYFLRLGIIGFGGPVALVGQMERELVGGAAGSPRSRCARPSRSASPCRGRWRSRSASTSPICARASGAHGRAAGRSSCRIS